LWGIFYFLIHLMFSLFFCFVCNRIGLIIELPLISLNSLNLRFIIILDWMSLGFIRFVILISRVVIFYRGIYMEGDLSTGRFINLVNLFVASMGILILRPNILSIILGWDGLGLVSFLLVIYYYNVPSLKSGLITIYTNRIGDVGMIFGLYLCMEGGDWTMAGIFNNRKWEGIGVFLILAGITKRAQLPFSAWLPAAMAAPTPVSSLVHSSTLVTAGVYLIIRFYYLLFNIVERKILGFIFLVTALIAGLVACFEPDLKRIVAISTLSQLGLILFILSLGDLIFCYYHIVCHALFKALLFLRCGILISIRAGGQDMRFIGGIGAITPGIRVLLGVSSLSLLGFPFLAGFYSKDRILERRFFYEEYIFFVLILLSCCVLTVIYSYKLFKIGVCSSRLSSRMNFYTERFMMEGGMLVLGFWSICLGSSFGYIIFLNPISMVSGWERIRGLVIILVGVSLGVLERWGWNYSKRIKEFFGELGFLGWFSSGFFSNSVYNMLIGSKGDLLWGELLGPKGVNQVISYLGGKPLFDIFVNFKFMILIGILWGLLIYSVILFFSLY
jgi:NADH-ubiquinone oxidoreductase chain 5